MRNFFESHGERLDNLTARLEAQEEAKGSSGAVHTMRDKLVTLQAEVTQFQSIGISLLLGDVPLPNVPTSLQEMPSNEHLPSE